jgi:uncharacterized protein YjbI with pentapeptide repeats
VTRTKLDEVLRLHGLWLDGAEGGVRADLTGAILTGADLTGAELTDVDLTGADLQTHENRRMGPDAQDWKRFRLLPVLCGLTKRRLGEGLWPLPSALPDAYCLQRTELWKARWGANTRPEER